MTADTALAYLVANAPAPRATVSPALLKAREALDEAARDLLAVPDGTLERTWRWRDRNADVRYGPFRAIEAVEEASGTTEGILANLGATRSTAALRSGPASAARGGLSGGLVVFEGATLERVAKDGEW